MASGVPPFLSKTYDIVDNPETDPVISWSESGKSFVIWNNSEFCENLLPKHFKHSNLASFVRQLNTYGFKKADPDRLEFHHPNGNFQRGHRDLLKGIQRRKGQQAAPSNINALVQSGQPAIELGQYGGLEETVKALQRDRYTLMSELVQLRHKQSESDQNHLELRKRLDNTEARLSQMIAFFSQLAQNPTVLAQMVSTAQQQSAYLEDLDSRRKKRRPDSGATAAPPADESQSLIPYQAVDVAAFFQNLLSSPVPPRREATTELAEHFGSFGLANKEQGLAHNQYVTISEHHSGDGSPNATSRMAAGDSDFNVPASLSAGVPTIGATPVDARTTPATQTATLSGAAEVNLGRSGIGRGAAGLASTSAADAPSSSQPHRQPAMPGFQSPFPLSTAAPSGSGIAGGGGKVKHEDFVDTAGGLGDGQLGMGDDIPFGDDDLHEMLRGIHGSVDLLPEFTDEHGWEGIIDEITQGANHAS